MVLFAAPNRAAKQCPIGRPEVGRCRYAANRSNWRRKFDPCAIAEALALGLPGAPADSASSPDAEIGFSDNALYGSSTDPDQTPSNNTYDLIGVAEHEISEGMGRVSVVNNDGSGGTTTNYSPIDLFRFSGTNDNRALTPGANPSYFSLDGGATPLTYWNNNKIDSGGDKADLAEYGNSENASPSVPDSSGKNYTPDAYNDASDRGFVNPLTAPDATLMNVLGYGLASPSETPALPSLENVLYFDGLDANGNNALWISGGTAATTQELVGVNGIVGDIVTASDITVLGSNILFNGADHYGNDGLWISNGTAPGTQEITGIANAASAAQGGLDPTDLTVVGNEVWFEGKDASGNVGLWETDGTAAGTHELVPGLTASNMAVYDNEVYFTGTDGGLWKTDGTSGGTLEIAGAPALIDRPIRPCQQLVHRRHPLPRRRHI